MALGSALKEFASMPTRILWALVAAITGATSTLLAQGQTLASRPPAQAPAPAPRTPWGHPDLQGTWDYRTITPLERAKEFGTREFYTDDEVKTLESRAGRRMDGPPEEV